MVRIKAANQQIKTELKSMQDQTNELGNQIQFIKDQSRSDTKNVSDIMEVVVKYILHLKLKTTTTKNLSKAIIGKNAMASTVIIGN